MNALQIIGVVIILVVISLIGLLPDFIYMIKHPEDRKDYDDEDTYIKL